MVGVSVVIPMKNAQSTIEKCILSMENQSYKPLEIIICDDGSTDGSPDVVEKLKNKFDNIKLLRNDTSKGAANARNQCIAESRYDYIAMQDADDWSDEKRIEKEMTFLFEHEEYVMVASGCYRVNETGEKKADIQKEYVEKEDLVWGGHFIHASCIFKKEALLSVGGYTDNKYTKRDQDYHLLMKLYAKGYKLYNMQECLYYYLSTQDTYTRQIDFSKVKGLMWIRYDGYKRNKMPLWAYLYVFKPLVACLIPRKIMLKYYKKER